MSLKRAMSKISIRSAKDFPKDFFKNHNISKDSIKLGAQKLVIDRKSNQVAEKEINKFSSRNKFKKPQGKRNSGSIQTLQQK